ncbi:hypothetical protein AL537_14245 [Vibrio diabolicus]|nr:hypothetical protein AL537_14245 [Vibrio diabolicus]
MNPIIPSRQPNFEYRVSHNAALSGEQRKPPYLNHCAVNTKVESNRKCQALGIRLKRFVSHTSSQELVKKF